MITNPFVAGADNSCPPALDFELRRLGEETKVNLCQEYLGKVILIVNTASKCGFTPQFEGLENLHEEYKDRGFVVMGFPSNDFANQDPGTEKEIGRFCRLTYGVKFPMFEKTHAKKSMASPLYKELGELAGEYPKWNFHKYLIDRQGNLAASFKSWTKPESKKLRKAIEDLL